MKKENKTLVIFLSVMAVAVAVGIVAGRNDAFSMITAPRPHWAQAVVVLSPLALAVSIIGAVWAFAKYRQDKKACAAMAEYTAIFTYTVFGVVVSGFYKMYSTENIIPVAISFVLAVVILLAVSLLQFVAQKNRAKNRCKSALALVFMCCVGLSVFLPLGPLPCVAVGTLWLTAAFLYNR